PQRDGRRDQAVDAHRPRADRPGGGVDAQRDVDAGERRQRRGRRSGVDGLPAGVNEAEDDAASRRRNEGPDDRLNRVEPLSGGVPVLRAQVPGTIRGLVEAEPRPTRDADDRAWWRLHRNRWLQGERTSGRNGAPGRATGERTVRRAIVDGGERARNP